MQSTMERLYHRNLILDLFDDMEDNPEDIIHDDELEDDINGTEDLDYLEDLENMEDLDDLEDLEDLEEQEEIEDLEKLEYLVEPEDEYL